jgi:hypothetical protein
MRNKTFTCALCGFTSRAPQGIASHVQRKHAPEFKVGKIDNFGNMKEPITGKWVKKGEKITEVEYRPMNAYDLDPVNTTEPFHSAILRDFERAVREHQTAWDQRPEDNLQEEQEAYFRAKRLLALRILLLKTRSDMAETIERELLS